MIPKKYLSFTKLLTVYSNLRSIVPRCTYSDKIYEKYNDVDKEKILHVLNKCPVDNLSSYNITKPTLKRLSQWKSHNAQLQSLSDAACIQGLTQRSIKRLFDGILEGPVQEKKLVNRIKGQVLQPALDETLRKNCKSILTLYIAVNSVSWVCINRENYEVTDWKYQPLDFPDSKKMQITDLFDISWRITKSLPLADIYVMKAEATTLRAAGSDPNNPKVISVNLQKSQMIAMIVALINSRFNLGDSAEEETTQNKTPIVKQRVFFLRPTLPYRLYGTLVGNEKVSTDQVVEILLQNSTKKSPDNSHFHISEQLKNKFRSSRDLQQDMLGHCLLLGLTFMDICVYRNQEKIQKLVTRGE